VCPLRPCFYAFWSFIVWKIRCRYVDAILCVRLQIPHALLNCQSFKCMRRHYVGQRHCGAPGQPHARFLRRGSVEFVRRTYMHKRCGRWAHDVYIG
jgi:hypothetical protein